MKSSKHLGVSTALILCSLLVACTSPEEGEKSQSQSSEERVHRIFEGTIQQRIKSLEEDKLELERHLASAGEQNVRASRRIQYLSEEIARLRRQQESTPQLAAVAQQVAQRPVTMPVRIVYFRSQPVEGDTLRLIPIGTSAEPVLRTSPPPRELDACGFYVTDPVHMVPVGTYQLLCENRGEVRFRTDCVVISRNPRRMQVLVNGTQRLPIPCVGNVIVLWPDQPNLEPAKRIHLVE